MKYRNTFLLLILMTGLIFGQVGSKHTITLDLAKKIAIAAENKAKEMKIDVVIAIVDEGGNLLFFERMDGAQLGSINVAKKKAVSAIYFKRPTKSYQQRISDGNNALLSIDEILPFEGGVPLNYKGNYIGAIGVSGGTPEQDGIIAEYASNVLREEEK
ncbi:GlcG/HbpS family heme-binding protein [Melioribacter sp. OK-6-Me]|uniref:GlcG/HbpS family heme-binding protein n=1 Tax=Melioribacter sp. OK-6-Me TaxID=3423433 RepID=UPI003ED8A96E